MFVMEVKYTACNEHHHKPRDQKENHAHELFTVLNVEYPIETIFFAL